MSLLSELEKVEKLNYEAQRIVIKMLCCIISD
jgi:hypothetical protein